MLFVKFIVMILLLFVMVSLFSGLFFLVKDKGQTRRTVNALTLRIGLSIAIIVVIIIAAATGLIELNENPMHGDQRNSNTSESSSTTDKN